MSTLTHTSNEIWTFMYTGVQIDIRYEYELYRRRIIKTNRYPQNKT